ncbi:MAG: sel1 repeat family protein [Lachnospiraceae bacterium]|nr:sel1 repeat family protein [Lachnospiraceae bacterium]
MEKYFNDVVDKAIEDLYYCCDNEKAKAAADALLLAAKEDDGDACYFLSRCFSGSCYSWEYHPFEEDEAAAYAMLRQAISLGSAAAVLGALRMDMLTPEMREFMPFGNIKEAWEVIYEKAKNGCAFCQYMIGNTYYFLDIIEIEDRKESEFANKKAWNAWKRQAMEQSIPWFEKAFSGGMILAGRNYCHYYQYGRGDYIQPEPEKAVPIMRQGAEMGYPEWMYAYANHLAYTEEKHKEALPWALKAAEAGHLWSWHIIGDIYWDGKAVERNLSYALQCYEKTAGHGNDSYACRQLGVMYFHGWGTAVDYARAVQWLEKDEEPEYFKYDLLGICYLLGYGCLQNPEKGKAFLERNKNSPYKSYGLGMMYAEGIGVREDIGKGVEYLKGAGNYGPAAEALKHYKKSLFGVWRRK